MAPDTRSFVYEPVADCVGAKAFPESKSPKMLAPACKTTSWTSTRKILAWEGHGLRTDILGPLKRPGLYSPTEKSLMLILALRCACDVPSHTYQFSWEPNPHWSKFYSPAPEILEYLNFVVDKHDLRKFMHFNHRARHSEWNESTSTWRVDLEITDAAGKVTSITKECEVLIQGLGTLNNFKYPDIEGLGSFRGDLMHTANWDSSKDLTGQKVAVIGNGASAVQVVAEIQPGLSPRFTADISIRLRSSSQSLLIQDRRWKGFQLYTNSHMDATAHLL